MLIEIKGKQPLRFDGGQIIHQLAKFIEKDIGFFEIIHEVLLTYNTLGSFSSSFFYENDVDEFRINYPHLNEEDLQSFFQIIIKLYSMTQKEFKDFRGEFTEDIVNMAGPFNIKGNYIHQQREVTFWIDGKKVSDEFTGNEWNYNLDIGYSDHKSYPSISSINCEAIECKIKIENYIGYKKGKEPPISKDRLDKIKFMDLLMKKFRESKSFFVLFATFTKNVGWQREVLQLLGIHKVSIISGNDLAQHLKTRNFRLD